MHDSHRTADTNRPPLDSNERTDADGGGRDRLPARLPDKPRASNRSLARWTSPLRILPVLFAPKPTHSDRLRPWLAHHPFFSFHSQSLSALPPSRSLRISTSRSSSAAYCASRFRGRVLLIFAQQSCSRSFNHVRTFYVQSSTKRCSPGCVNATGKARQK